MKKFMVLSAVIILCLTGMANDPGNSWVITRDGRMECKRVNLGYNKARIVLNNGQKNKVEFSNISALAMNGKLFTKLRLYVDNKPTKQMAFMELIKTCGDLSLYKLGFYDLGSFGSKDITYRYFLYNGNKMHLALNEKTLANICLHFGLTYDDL